MVRMSDLVRGVVREAPAAPAPAPRPAPVETVEPAAERVARTPRAKLGTVEPAATPPAPADPPAAEQESRPPAPVPVAPATRPAAPAESPQALFDELHGFMLQVREAVLGNAS